MSLRLATAAAALAATLSTPTLAALPTGTLEFVQRTGNASADERIAVVMRLTLDLDSAPLTFSSDPLFGFDPADIPTEGRFFNPDTQQEETRPFASVDRAILNTFYSCQGNFTTVCDPSANYSFEFNDGSSPGHPSIGGLTSFTLDPGASYEYTFGFFVPVAGGAAPGVYRWNGTGVTLGFQGTDADGNFGNTFDNMSINSDFSLDPAVAFERLVTAIPEPSTYALMALGLTVVGGFARRRPSSARLDAARSTAFSRPAGRAFR